MKDSHELTDGEVVAIDGRTICGPYNKSNSAIHMVNAFATAQGMRLAQTKVNSYFLSCLLLFIGVFSLFFAWLPQCS